MNTPFEPQPARTTRNDTQNDGLAAPFHVDKPGTQVDDII